MALLVRLGLRRPHKWERRTLLDWFLYSPLRLLVSKIYSIFLILRGHPFRPSRNKRLVRVVCISDTHDATFTIPKGDLLIHAGDMTNRGTVEDIQKQIDWLAAQPHEHKVVVCGNHDSWFDPDARQEEDKVPGAKSVDLGGVTFLQRESVTLNFFGGERVLNVYGAADVPALGLNRKEDAFEYLPNQHPWNGTIPRATDVLVTHTPPAHYMDLGLGCPGLTKELWTVKPRLHVFGHVHWGHGRRSVYFDKCQMAYESFMSRPARGPIWDCIPNFGWVDAVKVVVYGLQSVLFKWLMQGPGGGEGCLMVNAAMKNEKTGKMGDKFETVDL